MANLKKENKIMYSKGGNGSKYARVALPISWLEALGITEENKEVELEIKNDRIIIRAKGE